jgi:hypothetical protein
MQTTGNCRAVKTGGSGNRPNFTDTIVERLESFFPYLAEETTFFAGVGRWAFPKRLAGGARPP